MKISYDGKIGAQSSFGQEKSAFSKNCLTNGQKILIEDINNSGEMKLRNLRQNKG